VSTGARTAASTAASNGRRPRRSAAAAALGLALLLAPPPGGARAATPTGAATPARLRATRTAAVHLRPELQAPVVRTLRSHAEVVAVGAPEAGWQRVLLEGGGVGWVRASALGAPRGARTARAAGPRRAPGAAPLPEAALQEAGAQEVADGGVDAVPVGALLPVAWTTGAPGTGRPVGPTRAAARWPQLTVEDLPQVHGLVHHDDPLAVRTRSLASRQTAGWSVLGGGLAAGLALVAAGVLVPQQSCELNQVAGGVPHCSPTANRELVGTGAAVGVLGLVGGLLLLPRNHEVQEVVDAWNARHPSEQAEPERLARPAPPPLIQPPLPRPLPRTRAVVPADAPGAAPAAAPAGPTPTES
jgi:hypothetical protein